AAFLVLTVKDDDASLAKVREVLASTDDLIKNTAIREIERTFTCNVAIGHRVWAPLVGSTPPRELKPFQEVKGATHTAVSTPGDLLYHIRART
ncbi:peroxidase, partial [Acinetobacter baumannii]